VYASSAPLVIVGTDDYPIRINGPFVADGDVIIKGVVSGQGTIYAGRNIHIVGDIWYGAPPEWPAIWREGVTGQIDNWDSPDLGSVCSDGTYVPNTVLPAASRCP
jgi:hypothetical protein